MGRVSSWTAITATATTAKWYAPPRTVPVSSVLCTLCVKALIYSSQWNISTKYQIPIYVTDMVIILPTNGTRL